MMTYEMTCSDVMMALDIEINPRLERFFRLRFLFLPKSLRRGASTRSENGCRVTGIVHLHDIPLPHIIRARRCRLKQVFVQVVPLEEERVLFDGKDLFP